MSFAAVFRLGCCYVGINKRFHNKKKSPRAERYEKAQERQQGQYALVAALNQVENVPENLISQTSVP